MKYITGALAIIALLGEQANAVTLSQKAAFTDDLIKSLTEDMAKDEQKEEATPAKEEEPKKAMAEKKDDKQDAKKKDDKQDAKKGAKKDDKQDAKKKDDKQDAKKGAKKEEEKEKDEIPMDAAAIKAYSSVIADAAEDSEPATPVEYAEQPLEDEHKTHEVMSSDPMGSMIQNEISEIKDASIKAAKEKAEE